jgi:hypothetical protein
MIHCDRILVDRIQHSFAWKTPKLAFIHLILVGAYKTEQTVAVLVSWKSTAGL